MSERAERPLDAQPLRLYRSTWLKPTVLGALVLTALAAVYLSPLCHLFHAGSLPHWEAELSRYHCWAAAVFFLAASVGVALGAPRLFFAAVAGAAFGPLFGIPLALAATLLGCWITFTYGRALGREFVDRKLGGRLHRLRRLLDLIGEHGILANLLVRAAPIGNCFLANLLMSVSPIRPRTFLVGTFLGILPETLIYALFGSGVRAHTAAACAAAGVLLVALGAAYYLLIRRSALARTVAADLAGARTEGEEV